MYELISVSQSVQFYLIHMMILCATHLTWLVRLIKASYTLGGLVAAVRCWSKTTSKFHHCLKNKSSGISLETLAKLSMLASLF